MLEVRGPRILWTILLCFAPCLMSTCLRAQYGGGTGEPNDPYLIYAPEQMNAIGTDPNHWGKHFKLMADLDLSEYTGRQFHVIGSSTGGDDPINKAFSGVFDGNGHTIANFSYIGTALSCVGLFGHVADPNALIKNLGLIAPVIDAAGAGDVGSLVGHLRDATVTNCYAEGGSVSADGAVGGLVGNNRGTITNSYATCTVRGKAYVGGLVGLNGIATRGPAPASSVAISGTVLNCYAAGPVTGENSTGGLIGTCWAGPILFSFWDVEASGQAASAGGSGRSTAQMKDPNTFIPAGWDFLGPSDGSSDVWAMAADATYPVLWWQVPQAQWPSLPSFSGGSGTADDPYLISTPAELKNIGHNPRLMECHFKLANDVDLGGAEFPPIGCAATPFAGIFDGNDRKVANLVCTSANGYQGLFGYIRGQNARLENIGLMEPHVDVGKGKYAGALVGSLSGGTITNCWVEGGRIAGGHYVGGLAGYATHAVVTGCHSSAAIAGTGYYVGGLLGYDDCGTVTGSHCTGSVTGGSYVGGLVGSSYHSTIRDCYADATIRGSGAGGLVGSASGTISYCYATGAVSGSGVGGLLGSNYATVTHCHATGTVSGGSSVGGLVAGNYATIMYSRAAGAATGDGRVGGFAGWDEGTITSCYASGNVRGNTEVGGLTGSNSEGATTDCYASGAVRGNEYTGGFIGNNWGGTITNCRATGDVTGGPRTGGLAGISRGGAAITNCYATGSVKGDYETGGLVGWNSHNVTDCYARGAVSGGWSTTGWQIGGLIGHHDEGVVTGSFWDVQTSGQTTSAAGKGMKTAEMWKAQTFLEAAWDFVGETDNGTADIWWIDEGQDYPRLAWELENESADSNAP